MEKVSPSRWARRSGVRIGAHLQVLFEFRDPDSKRRSLRAGQTISVSQKGASIALEEPLPKIDGGVLHVTLPDPWSLLKIRGKIIWWDDRQGHYGIHFRPLPKEGTETDWAWLVQFINQSSSILPDRRVNPARRGQGGPSTLFTGKRKGSRRITECDLPERGEEEDFLGTVKGPRSVGRRDIPPRYRFDRTETAAIRRRAWLTAKTGVDLYHLGAFSGDAIRMESAIENFIGAAQVPIGLAGPIKIKGEFARGLFYVPLATTEATLVQTYSQGMQLLSLAGGVTTTVLKDENFLAPLFIFDTVKSAQRFVRWLDKNFEPIAQAAHQTTRHGRLLRIEPQIFDRRVVVKFFYNTGDAMGINIMTLATQAACHLITAIAKPEKYYFHSNFSSVKKVAVGQILSGQGKAVIAEGTVPAALVRRSYGLTPTEMTDYAQHVLFTSKHTGMLGVNGHMANALAALFMACGQDVAHVVESHIGFTHFEVVNDGALYLSVKLPNLLVGTVGGGTALATQKECLSVLGCHEEGGAKKFAEIAAATVLGGELAIYAANAAGKFASAFKNVRKRIQVEGAFPLTAGRS